MRLGTSPTLWHHDLLPELGPRPPYDEVLAAIARAGYQGTELGGGMPTDAAELKAALDRHQLALSAGVYTADLTEAVGDGAEPLLALLPAVDAAYMIVRLQLLKARSAIAGRVTQVGGVSLADAQWSALVTHLNALGERCRDHGVQLVFQPHAGTWIETPNEVQRLLNQTDPAVVGLCLDTGHCVFGGGNPLEAVDRFHRRLGYLRVRDVNPYVVVDVTSQGKDYAEALRRGVFTALGQGCVDLQGLADRLAEHGYDGWIVADQDGTKGEPCDAAAANQAVLGRLFAARV